MKKIYLYSIAALGFSLMACDGYKEPNPAPQTNPQLPVLQVSDVGVENALTGSLYNLEDLANTGTEIELAKVSCSTLGEGYNFGAIAEISDNDFANSYSVPVISEKEEAQDVWVLYINPTVLSDIYHENITWGNDQATISLRYNVTTTYTTSYGTQTAYVGGSSNYYGPYSVNIQPIEANVHYYYLYTPGESNGWSPSGSQPLYSESESGTFTGYVVLSGEFKFTSEPSWDGTNYGAGEEEGILSTDSEAGNLSVDAEGLYYCTVNTVDLNYSVAAINTIGIIGSATPMGWDLSTPMTTEDNYIWTAQVNLVPGEYKFRANDDWDINLGGDPNSLTQGGDNIVFNGEEGTYTVTLNLKDIPYSCSISK